MGNKSVDIILVGYSAVLWGYSITGYHISGVFSCIMSFKSVDHIRGFNSSYKENEDKLKCKIQI